MEFSILQSVYKNDKPDYLDECFLSIFESTIKPKEIVLVKDGPVDDDINKVIDKWKDLLKISTYQYESNRGLAFALNYGLKFVKTDLVARMDSDDIVCIDRFEKQINFFEKNSNVVLLSGYIDEFDNNPNIIKSKRKIPTEYEEIKKFLKSRNAFNHMAVMFKKSAVIDSGGYQIVPYFEDYDLWIRIVQKGYFVNNLSDTLVKARIGNDMIGRRHGLSYAKHEIYFFKRQLNSGFISRKEYFKLIIFRVPVRLLPKSILKFIYKLLRH